jgi:hypothetical protein
MVLVFFIQMFTLLMVEQPYQSGKVELPQQQVMLHQ